MCPTRISRLWSRLFPYVLPIGVWGGLLQYPALAYLVMTGRLVEAILGTSICCLLWYNKRSFAGVLRMRPGTFPTYIHSGTQVPVSQRRSVIHLLHPHALFTEGMSQYALSAHRTTFTNTVVLIDKWLYRLSPLGMVWMMMCGCPEVCPLIHTRIKDILGRGQSVIVFPGGFMEIADFSHSHETLYLHMYPYWMRMAREYMCDAYTTVGYNLAGRHFQQSSWLQDQRLSMARRSIPGILPIGIVGTRPEIPVYMLTHQIDPVRDTLESIRDSIRQRLDIHENIHGVGINYVIRTTKI